MRKKSRFLNRSVVSKKNWSWRSPKTFEPVTKKHPKEVTKNLVGTDDTSFSYTFCFFAFVYVPQIWITLFCFVVSLEATVVFLDQKTKHCRCQAGSNGHTPVTDFEKVSWIWIWQLLHDKCLDQDGPKVPSYKLGVAWNSNCKGYFTPVPLFLWPFHRGSNSIRYSGGPSCRVFCSFQRSTTIGEIDKFG